MASRVRRVVLNGKQSRIKASKMKCCSTVMMLSHFRGWEGEGNLLSMCRFAMNLLLSEAINSLPGNILLYECFFPTFVGCVLPI